jgi:4-aminobutyrate aminotransferase-like enzyme
VTIFPIIATGGSGLPLVENARGWYLYDAQGRDYLDTGRLVVLNVYVGHSRPAVLSAIRDQIERVALVHRTEFDTIPT